MHDKRFHARFALSFAAGLFSEQKSPKAYHFAWLKEGRFHSTVVEWASFTMRFALRENDVVAVR
jgi:hypothetical protein